MCDLTHVTCHSDGNVVLDEPTREALKDCLARERPPPYLDVLFLPAKRLREAGESSLNTAEPRSVARGMRSCQNAPLEREECKTFTSPCYRRATILESDRA